jgi:nitrile hydratase accessory protein
LTQPETDQVKPFKRMDGEAVFDEQWQAQVLAMADTLITNGVISASLWSETLGTELRKTQSRRASDNITNYYKAALQALEQLLEQNTDISKSEVSKKRDAWEQAYLATPHGQPVKLKE